MTPRRTGFVAIAALLPLPLLAQFGSMGAGGMGQIGLSSPSGSEGRPTEATWQPWLSMGGSYRDSARYVEQDGTVTQGPGAFGASGGWGLRGQKALERTAMYMAYNGRATLYSKGTGTRGTSHVFSAGVSHRFTQKLYAAFQQTIGSSLGGYGYGSGFAGAGGIIRMGPAMGTSIPGLIQFDDPGANGLVDDEIFDNRVKFFASSASAGYRINMRSTVSVAATARFARRNNSALADSNIYSGSASYSYLINRSTRAGVAYSLGAMRYPNKFGENRFQSAYAFVGRRLTGRSQISGSAGVVYFDSQFIGTIAVDPDLSSLLGITAITSVQQSSRMTFAGSANYSYISEFAHFGVFASRGIVPGNGILYGGIRDTFGASMGRSLVRNKVTSSLSASMGRTSGVNQPDTQFRYQMAGSLAYYIGGGFHGGASAGLRWQRLAKTGPFLPQKFITVGVTWSPGDFPLFF